MKKCRRIATHRLLAENGTLLKLYIVELEGGLVKTYYPFTHEIEHTEWMSGEIVLKRDITGGLRAFYNEMMIE